MNENSQPTLSTRFSEWWIGTTCSLTAPFVLRTIRKAFTQALNACLYGMIFLVWRVLLVLITLLATAVCLLLVIISGAL